MIKNATEIGFEAAAPADYFEARCPECEWATETYLDDMGHLQAKYCAECMGED